MSPVPDSTGHLVQTQDYAGGFNVVVDCYINYKLFQLEFSANVGQ